MADTFDSGENDGLRPFFFDVAEIPGYTISEIFAGSDDAEHYYEIFGRDLLTKVIVQTPDFSVFHETAPPGEQGPYPAEGAVGSRRHAD